MPNPSSRIRGVIKDGSNGWEVYYRAVEMQASGRAVTMLSIGDHDIKTDRDILDAMQASAIGGNVGYTSVAGSHALRAAIAHRAARLGHDGVSPDNVIVTSGGQGALFSAMMAVLDPGDGCVVLDPYYATFDVTVRAAGGEPVIVPTRSEDGFQPDAEAIAAALTPRTRAILLNTPNNPSGAVYDRDRLEAVAALARQHDLWVISDELYDGQIHVGAHVSPRSFPGMAERTIVIGSMSKGYAMTGARIGWAIAPRALTVLMVDLAGATTYGLPGFLQDAAVYALTERAELEDVVAERYSRRRNIAVAALAGSNTLRAVPPEGGMYVMLDVRGTGLDGIAFAERLLDACAIGVMPGESFGEAAAGHIRIALTVDDAALEDAMRRIVTFAESVAVTA